MIFSSDELRHDYHKTPLLLQVVCQLLESELAAHHIQLELVDCAEEDDGYAALVVVNNEEYEDIPEMQIALETSVANLNSKFTRKDEEPTAILESGNYGLVTIRVTTAQDFVQIQ